jgi:hypothetical protein
MKIKIKGSTETMFSQAVALSQNGKMKNTIYGGKEGIFIKNMDNTILIKFDSQQEFPDSFSFFANDYESNIFSIENNKIVFETDYKGLKKRKECPVPKDTYGDILDIWNKHVQNGVAIKISISSNIIPLLDEGLSHIEVYKNKTSFHIIQRDIYSGSKIEIKESKAVENLIDDSEGSFDTIGLRTVDFISLFTFSDNIEFFIQPEENWVYFEDSQDLFSGILSTCLYDEIGYVAETKE